MRFGVLVLPDAPFDELAERWRVLEAMGFDAIYVADHTGDYRDLGGHWFDGWTVLAAMAERTSRVRVGTLVSNPIIRHPTLLAKEALAIDHLSGGRLELGIGTGIAAFDHAAMGSKPWQPRERAARFAEYVRVVDGVMRAPSATFRFDGTHYRSTATSTRPGPLQRPRPPITLGGQSPTVRRVAAELADCWNTHGPFGAPLEEILDITRRQNAELDERCVELGRDPADVRRSLLMFEALDAWAAPDAFDRIVTRFSEQAGIGEFVAFWPPEDRLDLLERAAGRYLGGR